MVLYERNLRKTSRPRVKEPNLSSTTHPGFESESRGKTLSRGFLTLSVSSPTRTRTFHTSRRTEKDGFLPGVSEGHEGRLDKGNCG